MMTRFANLLPDFIKPILRPAYRAFQRIWHLPIFYRLRNATTHRKTRNELREYWRRPDSDNLPLGYLKGEERSRFLVELVNRYSNSSSTILEIGCNVGRNLNHLFLAGFKQLAGIEISEDAVKLLREAYPEMARASKIYNKPVEEVINELEDDAFDIVFTVVSRMWWKSRSVYPTL